LIRVHDRPLLPLGRQGTFDDSGIMPSWLVTTETRKYLYYVGWNREVSVPYLVSIGLAVSDDGHGFEKISEGPIYDRSTYEPFFATNPCVVREGMTWRMWYASCTKWEVINDHPEPFYNIKYAESLDGMIWHGTGITCIDYDDFAQAIGRPCVYSDRDRYRMLF